MRVCYFGTYRSHYSRNQIMIAGLRRNNVEVIECHVLLWRGIEDRVEAASGRWLRPSFLLRVIRTYYKLLKAYMKIGDYDVMVLGYPGQLDVYLARLLTWIRRKPLVLDVFMSIYLIAAERGLTNKHPLTGRLIYGAEKLACLLPDLLILDTMEYVCWFQETYGLNPDRFRLVPTGADDRVFRPVDVEEQEDEAFTVIYYGTFIPNHGVDYIMEAARMLKDEPDVHFELVGEGPAKAPAMALAQEYGLDNVTFVGWVDKEELPYRVARADVCLGAFGQTPQSLMTIQNKIYEGMAVGKPVVTGDSPAVRDALTDGEHLLVSQRDDPQSLVHAIMRLKAQPALRARLSKQGLEIYMREFTPHALGGQLVDYLSTVLLNKEHR
jgi:glycosyltransferase involved in cell wall biosynthesis